MLSSGDDRSYVLTARDGRGRVLFAIAFFAMWTAFALLKVYPGSVHFDTSEFYMWSTLGFKLGYVKHPPLLTWIVGALAEVVPVTWVTLTLLAVANIAIGAYAVWRIALMLLGERRAMIALTLFCISPYATWHAVKLDHSSVQVSVWPLAVWAFLLVMREPTAKRGLVLGLAAALAMYAKYSSALLLFAMFVAAVASERRGEIFRSIGPYVAVGVLLALFAPHIWWVAQDSWSTVKFASQSVAPGGHIPTGMLASNLSRALPLFAGFFVLYLIIGRRPQPAPTAAHEQGFPFERELSIILLVTYVLTIVITGLLGLRASANWTMPIFALLPIYLAGLLAEPTDEQLASVRTFMIGLLAALPFAGAAMLAMGFKDGSRNVVEPHTEITRESAALWSKTFGMPVGIVAGSIRYSAAAALELPERPRAWVQFADYWWITPEVIAERGVLGFCADTDADCRQKALSAIATHNGWTCEIKRSRRLWGMQGPEIAVSLYFIPPNSFAGPLPPAESRCPPPG